MSNKRNFVKITFRHAGDKWERIFESWDDLVTFLKGKKHFPAFRVELIEG